MTTCADLAIPAEPAAPEPAAQPDWRITGQILGDHPEWAYLFDRSLPVRPPTVAEESVYQHRRNAGGEWADLYKARDEAGEPISVEDARALWQRCHDDYAACKPMSEEACRTSDAEMQQRRENVLGPLYDWVKTGRHAA